MKNIKDITLSIFAIIGFITILHLLTINQNKKLTELQNLTFGNFLNYDFTGKRHTFIQW